MEGGTLLSITASGCQLQSGITPLPTVNMWQCDNVWKDGGTS
jgi:hypothetical protein